MTARQRQRAAKAYARMCKYVGITFKGESTDTPERVVHALEEMTKNVNLVSKGQLDFTFTTFSSRGNDIVVCRNIKFTTICSHHHLPFFGNISIGYLPDKHIVGLSKLPRLVEFYSHCPTLQEELTARIADDLLKRLKPCGLLVRTSATHLCVCGRGVENDCETITCAVRGPIGAKIKDEIIQHIG